MRKGRIVAFVLVVAAFVAALVVGSMGAVQAECDLCIEFNGRTECRTGSGANEQEAIQAAKKAACAVMATGMAESVNCQNTPAVNQQCSK